MMDSAVADIFRAHEIMIRDEGLLEEIRNEIGSELLQCEQALHRVFGRWEEKFRKGSNETLRLRADDIADLGRRLLRQLAGVEAHSLEQMPEGSVVVAKRLLPSETIFLSQRSAVAIVAQFGGPGSHCAILARAMGIPAVVQDSDLFGLIRNGDCLLVDGLRGRVEVRPGPTAVQSFRVTMKQYQAGLSEALARSADPATTRDGVRIPVMANIGDSEDAKRANENGADGIGLYRIETFFLSRQCLPTEAELFKEIREAIQLFEGKPVCVRLMDIGGDKPLPYLPLPPEPNPNLGRRGIRFLLDYPNILQTQLRVALRLAEDHDMIVLVPMVTTVEDLRAVAEMLRRTAEELGSPRLPRLGAMIETPVAALYPEEIIAEADFISIGTNDLTQFLMAADRENPLVARYFREGQPYVMKAMASVCEDAKGKTVAVCGELASDITSVEGLVQAGVRALSVAPPMLPLVKEAVRNARAVDSSDSPR
jgi:phosphoenolpyruvate-protein phosphotransferase